MNLTAILEVAIGIVFIWMILSIATMQIQEWIFTWTKKRSKDLEEAIRKMLAEPPSDKFSRFKLADYFYDHPIIRGLTAEIGKRPSYIPARQFATALFDIAMTAGTEASYIQQGLYSLREDIKNEVKDKKARQALQSELNDLIEEARTIVASEEGQEALNRLKEKIKYFSNTGGKDPFPKILDAANTVLDEAEKLYKAYKPPKKDAKETLEQIQNGLVALSTISPEASRILDTLVSRAGDYASSTEKSIALARTNVENWFDSSMDRLGGLFKRNAQKVALFIGIFLAFSLNVDSIALTQHLWREPTTRQILVEKGENFKLDENTVANDPEKAMQEFNDQFSGLNLPIGWIINPYEEGDKNCVPNPDSEDEYFGIQYLWLKQDFCLNPSTPTNSSNIFVKLVGILITGFATMQGAPYWFDILKKLINVRGTGKKPEEK